MRRQVRIVADEGAVAAEAASLFAGLAREAAARGRRFAAALSGGSTPRRLYGLLGRAPWREAVPWTAVHLFWGDERCVGPEDEESNYRAAWEGFISRVGVPPGNVHRIRGELDPGEAARLYEAEIVRVLGGGEGGPGVPPLDLVLLGLGADGHTLSLFPGSQALCERRRLVVENYVEGLGAWRVTMTPRLVNGAGRVVFLVTGSAKAGIVREMLEGDGAGRLPAGLIAPLSGPPLWLLDREAAGLLSSR
ncbi:MAG TPA: 6-phosphogluconolactonase [Deltaproteobacteria bacterium]|nr:6-phosphogluconolactonase [Deltaproteobacteria bacterium]